MKEGRIKLQIAVINASAPSYNLGAMKMADWYREQGHEVTVFAGDPGMFGMGFDKVCVSVIFSWHAPIAREIALRYKANADVECGGPGMFALHKWFLNETGLQRYQGLDPRFEKQRGSYKMAFASRGCPVNCSFCIVPRIEGVEFSLDYDFVPAPMLGDNNLSALPVEFQDHIIRRYQETNTALLDANSGFEPHTFNEETYRRWKPILRGPWRFALDEMREVDDVRRMMHILKDETTHKKRVYVLIGNEPFKACYERAEKVIEWGGEPYCQAIMLLNTLEKEPVVRYDWTLQRLKDFQRYYSRPAIYKTCKQIWNYERRGEKPFDFVRAQTRGKC